MKATAQTLKRSRVITAISIGLMLAPLGNFLFSAWTFGASKHIHADLWVKLLSLTHPVDIAMSLGLFVSGALLWRQHRASWLLAVGILSVVTALNIRAAMIIAQGNFPSEVHFQLILNFVSTVACFAVVLYMRYPYIDRRHGWVANDPRYDSSIPCVIRIGDQSLTATLVSISQSGGRIEYQSSPGKVFQPSVSGVLDLDSNRSCDFEVVFQVPGTIRLRWKERIRNVEKWMTEAEDSSVPQLPAGRQAS